jgi:hypothetical protein
VNAFQSDKLFHSGFHDHLFYEWDIYHFHLSKEMDKKNNKFVKRTDVLLFAYIDNQKAVLLDVESHTLGIFAHEKWIEILDAHFPSFIEKYLAKGITDFSPNLNAIERQQLWDKGYTIGMIKINGKIYRSPGLGRTASGHSILVTMEADNISRWIFSLTDQFTSRFNDICKAFGFKENIAKFQLHLGKTGFQIIEESSKTVLLTYSELFEFKD